MEKNIVRIDIRCKMCNQKLMVYEAQGEDCNVALPNGLSICCNRCKRVLRFKKYTEKMLLDYSKNGIFKI